MSRTGKEILIMMVLLISIMLWDGLSKVFTFFNESLIFLWMLLTPFAIAGLILLLEWIKEKLKLN
jgi:hypothetical protein